MDNVLESFPTRSPGLRQVMQREMCGCERREFRGFERGDRGFGILALPRTIYSPDEVNIERPEMRSNRFPIRSYLHRPEFLGFIKSCTRDLPWTVPSI